MNGPVLLVGNQNAGKSTLFNALTGLNAKVANYPGVTVEAKVGSITRFIGERVSIVDLPGTYSLIPASEEEELTVKAVFGEIADLRDHRLIVVVIDSTELRRGFYLYSQIIELGFQAIVALTMVDQRPELSERKNIERLQKRLGTYVVPISSKNPATIERLIHTIDGVLCGSLLPKVKELPLLAEKLDDELKEKLSIVGGGLKYLPPHAQKSADLIQNHNIFLYRLSERWRLGKSLKDLVHLHLSPKDREELDRLLARIPEERFHRVDAWIHDLGPHKEYARIYSDKLDKILLHPKLGLIFLFIIFVGMLQALFLLAQPLADYLSDTLGLLSNYVHYVLPTNSLLHSLVTEGIIEGLGSILSFLPLIALLFGFLGLLEDSGYLARATYILDRSLKRIGLCGRSLAPMLSSFACAVPAILATRTIANKKERLITILVLPFLTCSARLPVYGLIVAALFSSIPPLFGIFDVGALMFMLMYALGIFVSLCAAKILSRVLKSNESSRLAIELPPYRLPKISIVLKRISDRIFLFLRDVGSVIFAATILVWALFRFEPGEIASLSNQEVSAVAKTRDKALENSYAGIIGKTLEPLVSPMGLDWHASVGIVASFLAREVFVSTMAVVYGLDAKSEEDKRLKQAFQKNVTPLSGFALLVFFTLAMQCVSTMAAVRRETGTILWPFLQFIMMTGTAWIAAVVSYQIGFLLGLG
jgi:ferrous iron transport protein B